MWVIAFFSVLLVAVIIYAALVKSKIRREKFMEEGEPTEDDEVKPHSPLR
jgi:hypothetical protein